MSHSCVYFSRRKFNDRNILFGWYFTSLKPCHLKLSHEMSQNSGLRSSKLVKVIFVWTSTYKIGDLNLDQVGFKTWFKRMWKCPCLLDLSFPRITMVLCPKRSSLKARRKISQLCKPCRSTMELSKGATVDYSNHDLPLQKALNDSKSILISLNNSLFFVKLIDCLQTHFISTFSVTMTS